MEAAAIRDVCFSEVVSLARAHSPRELIRRNIFIIRQLDAIEAIYDLITDSFAAEYGRDEGAIIASFLDDGVLPPEDSFVRVVTHIEKLRDSRAFSKIFCPVVSEIACGTTPTLIDTGYLRIVLPRVDYVQALRLRPELQSHFHGRRDRHDPEVMVVAGGALPHRDIQAPQFSTQMNFWFPLHRLEAEGSLLLFPQLANRNVASYPAVRELPLEQWGTGLPLQVALQRGDTLLFHSEQYHASPVKAGLRPRISMEIRVSLACPDDNAFYRRLFWDLRNFVAAPAAANWASRRPFMGDKKRGRPLLLAVR